MAVSAAAVLAGPQGAGRLMRAPEIVHGLQLRDQRALEQLFALYGRTIRRWASTEGNDAEDVLQDVLLKVWRNGPRLRDDTDLPALLKTVTMNTVRNRWRTKARRPSVPVGLDPDVAEVSDPIASRTESLAIEEALDGLSERERACLRLLYLSDLPLDDVAQRLGSSREATKSLAARARRRVRAELSRSDDTRRHVKVAAALCASAIVIALAGVTLARGETVAPSPRPVAAVEQPTEAATRPPVAERVAPGTVRVADLAPAHDTDRTGVRSIPKPPVAGDEEPGPEPCAVPTTSGASGLTPLPDPLVQTGRLCRAPALGQ